MKAGRYGICASLAIVAAITSGALLAQAPQAIGTWVSIGDLSSPLTNGASVALPDKRTLIAGGALADGTLTDAVTIYDSVDDSTAAAGTLTSARADHTATLLKDGRVLVVGGMTADGLVSSDIEIFDPATGTSAIVALLPEPRNGHVAAALPNGNVLIAGGATVDGAILQTAVLFDPETSGVFSVPGHLHTARVHSSATTMLDGRVLVAGGSNGTTELASAEIYDRYSQSFSMAATQMSVGRQGHSAVLLPDNGGVLVAGGTSNGVAQAGVDVFLPAVFPDPFSYGEGEFASTGAMTAARTGAVAGPTSVEGYAFAAAGGSPDAEVYRFATIKTDKDDYAPGELATITGSGWQPNEEVTLLFQEDPAVHDDYVLKVNADGNGNIFWNQWAPEHHDIGVRFYLTATDSRSRAQMTFTDAPKVGAVIVGAQSGTVIQGTPGSATYTVTVTRGNSQAAVGAVMSIGSLPNGVTASFSPSTVNIANGQNSGTSTLTLTTTALSPATTPTFSFTVKATEGSQDFATANGTLTIQSATTSSLTTVICPASVTYNGSAQAPCSATVTGAGGLNQALTVSYTANINVGTVTASASFPGDATHGQSAGSATFAINKTNAVCTISGYSGGFNGAAHGASGSCTGVAGDPTAVGSTLDLGAKFTNAPGGTAHWTFTGGTNYNDQSGDVAIDIAKANATVSVSGYSGIYDAAEHGATGGATGVLHEALTGLNLGAKFTDAPGGTAHWTFTGGTNYNDQSGDVTIDIAKANAIVSVSGYSGIYDGAEHGATGSATGVLHEALTGLDLGAKFTDAPGGTANWTFTGGTNYKDQSGSVAITINKADATITVHGYTGIYDAHAHGATGNASGVGDVDLSAGLTLGATFTNVPGGTANWTFSGGTNYNDQSGTAAIVINKADAAITVNGYTGTYDALAHGATGTATGVGGVDLSAGLTLGATFTDVPGGTAHWTFAGGTNYNEESGTAAIVINKADAHVVVNGYTGTYDAHAHGATGSATGIGDVDLSAGLTLGETFTNVPGGTANWTFSGGTNYNDQSGTAAIVINKADAAITVNGYTGTYDALAHGATGTATGVGGVDLSAGLDLGQGFTNVPGGTANWTFTGGTNYNDQSGTAAIVINKADAHVVVNGYTGIYDAHAHGATGTATGVDDVDLSGGLTLGATFTNVPGGTANWTFTGGTNYNDDSGSVAIVITKADAACTVTGYTGTYDAASHGASGNCVGVASDPTAAGSSLNVGASYTNAPGGTADWSFTGGSNYNDQSGSVAITINKANATISVTGYSGTFDGNAHGAAGTANGVGGVDLSLTLDLGQSFTNAPGGTAHWAFNGAPNYNDESGSVAIVIIKASAVCTITGYSVTYDAASHGASGSCVGVGNDPTAAGSSLNLGATFTNVPGGTANWTFTGGTNYNDKSGTVAIVINKADAACTITAYTGTYDAMSHGASGSCVGVLGDLAAVGSNLDKGASYTNVPGGTANWSFTGGTNYKDHSGSVAITINKANGVINVSGYTGIYDGHAHGATGSAVGVMGESLAGLSLGGSFTNVPGGTADWTFTDQTGNYNDADGHAAIVITKANPIVSGVSGYSGVYNGQPHGAYGQVKGVLNETLASLDLGETFSNVPGGTAHWTFTDQTGNYNHMNGTVQVVIYKADATCTVTGYDVIFDNVSHTATGACTGVNNSSLAGLGLSGTSHKDAGVYTDAWTFTDVTGNYNNTSGPVVDRIGHWTTEGFYQPVDMSGAQIVWNTVKGGSTVPLKFNLSAGAQKKTSVADVKNFVVFPMSCFASSFDSAIELTTTGGTALRYDGTGGQFIQNWQTPKTPGQCYMVRLTALDNSVIDAYFKTK